MYTRNTIRLSLAAGMGLALLTTPAQAAGWLKNIIQVQQPAVQAPAVQVQQPTIQQPVIQAPALQAPTVQAPAIQVQQPTVQPPAVQAPTVQVPGLAQPAAAQAPGAPCTPHDFSMAKLAKVLKHHGNHLVIDVRSPGEYASGHIPHAINLPLGTETARISGVCSDANQAIYVYCQGGVRSAQAAANLAGMGYRNVYDCGGINSWEGKIVR